MAPRGPAKAHSSDAFYPCVAFEHCLCNVHRIQMKRIGWSPATDREIERFAAVEKTVLGNPFVNRWKNACDCSMYRDLELISLRSIRTVWRHCTMQSVCLYHRKATHAIQRCLLTELVVKIPQEGGLWLNWTPRWITRHA